MLRRSAGVMVVLTSLAAVAGCGGKAPDRDDGQGANPSGGSESGGGTSVGGSGGAGADASGGSESGGNGGPGANPSGGSPTGGTPSSGGSPTGGSLSSGGSPTGGTNSGGGGVLGGRSFGGRSFGGRSAGGQSSGGSGGSGADGSGGTGALAGQSLSGSAGFGADASGGMAALAGQSGGGDGGSGNDGGASGAGPGVLGPPGPGVRCGEATCEDPEVCCVDASSRSCEASYCSGGVIRVVCDDSVDCPGQICCFAPVLESAYMATGCSPDCGDYYIEVCKEAGDCSNGDSCHVYRCSVPTGATASITLGLCTASAPTRCE